MAPRRLKIGITATRSSKLSLNSLNLICEMNGSAWPRRLPPHTAGSQRLAPPPLLGSIAAEFEYERVFIYEPNYGLSAIFARLSSGVAGGGGGGVRVCMCICVCICVCVCTTLCVGIKKSKRSNNYVYVRRWKIPGL